MMNRRGLWLFGSLLMLDGLYLAWASYMTGGSNGPLRYLILVHLGAVTLLASYRTGVKMALWHSLLLLCVFYARAGRRSSTAPARPATSGTASSRSSSRCGR